MGLDMYLTAERYVYSFLDEDASRSGIIAASGIADLASDEFSVLVRIPVMYWRKANAIHRWFVENVQDGTDDCGMYPVKWDHIEEVYEAVCEVLEGTPPDEVLPSQSGCFFGSVEYDRWYYDDLKATKEKFNRLLARKDELVKGGWHLHYQSSW